jgi:hypothetical protein
MVDAATDPLGAAAYLLLAYGPPLACLAVALFMLAVGVWLLIRRKAPAPFGR